MTSVVLSLAVCGVLNLVLDGKLFKQSEVRLLLTLHHTSKTKTTNLLTHLFTMSNLVNKVFHRNSTDSKDASNTSVGSTDYKNNSTSAVNSKSSDLKNDLKKNSTTSTTSSSSKDLPVSPSSPSSKTAGIPPAPNGVGRSADVTRSDGTHRHSQGHSVKDNVTDLSGADPANITQEVHHLGHVTHDTQRRHEVEEVERLKEQHNHHTHIQHHVQPIKHEEHGTEKVEAKAHPVTQIHEKHSSTDSDATLLDSVTGGHKSSVTQAPLDRKVVDKGEFVKEIDHHHIKNVIQPVVHQDTHSYNRIQTTIPTTHTVLHAPIVHETTSHEPISKADFLKTGGVLGSNTKSVKELGVLHDGKCERKVNGVAEKLEKELGLSPSSHATQTV